LKLTKRGRLIAALGIFVLILGVLAAPAALWLRSVGLLKPSDPHGKVTVIIPKGSGVSDIGDLLADKDVIDSAFGFRIAVYLEGGSEDIQAGAYELPQGLSAKDALAELLARGPKDPDIVRVTFPEGSWLTDFAATLDENTDISGKEFLAITEEGQVDSPFKPKNVDTLEGLLFPSTYEVGKNETAAGFAQRLADEFVKQTRGLGFERAKKTGIDPYEAITIASMIEAEAYVDKERPMIARVIYNRLNIGMPLGIDATISYALGEHKGSLSSSDLDIDSPYNTRKEKGLPPTPIGAPGLSSLRAALDPAAGDWLYYVLADCEGHHAFSSSYNEFLKDKAVYESLDC
jgi:UPF0755 protein